MKFAKLLIPVFLLLFSSAVFSFTATGSVDFAGLDVGNEEYKKVQVEPLQDAVVDASALLLKDQAEFSFSVSGDHYPRLKDGDSLSGEEIEVEKNGNPVPQATILCYYNGVVADCCPGTARSKIHPLDSEQSVDAGGTSGLAVFRVKEITGPYFAYYSLGGFYELTEHGETGGNVEVELEVKLKNPDTGEYFQESGQDKWFSSQEEIDEYAAEHVPVPSGPDSEAEQIAGDLEEAVAQLEEEAEQIVQGTTIETDEEARNVRVNRWIAGEAVETLEDLQGVFVPFGETTDFVIRARFMAGQFREWQSGEKKEISFQSGDATAPFSFTDPKYVDATALSKWFLLHDRESHPTYRFELVKFKPAVKEITGGELTEIEPAEAKIAVYMEGVLFGEDQRLDCSAGYQEFSRYLKANEDTSEWGQRCDKGAESGGWRLDGILLYRISGIEGPYYEKEGSTYELKAGPDNYEISVFFDVKLKTNHSPENFTGAFSGQGELDEFAAGQNLTVKVLDGEETRNPVSGTEVLVEKESHGLERMNKTTDYSGIATFNVPAGFPLDIVATHDVLGMAEKSVESAPTETLELFLSSEYVINYYAVIGQQLENAFMTVMLEESAEPLGSLEEVYAHLHEFFNLLDKEGGRVEYEVVQPFAPEMTFSYVNAEGETEFVTRPVYKILKFPMIEKGKCYTMEVVTDTPSGMAAVLQEWCIRSDGSVIATEEPRVERR